MIEIFVVERVRREVKDILRLSSVWECFFPKKEPVHVKALSG